MCKSPCCSSVRIWQTCLSKAVATQLQYVAAMLCMLADVWVEGNPLQPQSLVPLLRRLAMQQPPELRELGLDADQVYLPACLPTCQAACLPACLTVRLPACLLSARLLHVV